MRQRGDRTDDVEVGEPGTNGGEDIVLEGVERVEDDSECAGGVILQLILVDVEHDVVGIGGSDEGRNVAEADVLEPLDPLQGSVEVSVG